MEWDTGNLGDAGGAVRAWAASLEPLAQELRRTEAGSSERETAVDRVIEQMRGAIRGLDAAGDIPAVGVGGAGQWLRGAAPLLAGWPHLGAPLQALELAFARLASATKAASGELEQVVELAGAHWRGRALTMPAESIDAWWLAEQWSLAMEEAWDQRLETAAHGEALRELQQTREEFRQAAASVLDTAAAALGLPGPGAVAALEAAVDRLDRDHDRDTDALRAEVDELREEVRQLRRDGNHSD
ncbi:hypothetical protein HC341_02355 [Aquisalimonas sp. 2447]|uniref:hypothetical protein n=1 Tax=Aquisalimonas sp. 2447 TaxID=2740807 RepID=UPI0014324C41|nr:hypothetical protein [Aquisalimonas sp. 2447]QIT54160.1 hypothetical protein HC341_02355 [Aquisalimonas sp. 2447]